jgi:hypothetical protein
MLGIKFNTLFATPKSYSWIDQIFRVKSKFWLECRSQFKRAEPKIFRAKLSSCKRNRRTKKRGSACRNLSVPYPKWLSCKRGLVFTGPVEKECLWNEILASFFFVLLKGTAQMMKSDVYGLFLSHLVPKLSYFVYFELWLHKKDLRYWQ